jgi:hypothetical protein
LARKKIRVLADGKTLHMAGVFVKLQVYTVCINLAEEKNLKEVVDTLQRVVHTVVFNR